MKVVEGLYYTNDHEWLKVDGDEAYIGLSDFAQDQLEISYMLNYRKLMMSLLKRSFSPVESVKAAADVYMPVDGKITAVNEELLDDPALLNQDPYETWIVKIELTDKSQLDELMTSDEYEKFLDEEV